MSSAPAPPSAIAEIEFAQDWNLSPAGTANPLRYWSHVRFENDATWGQEYWTLFVEIDDPPADGQRVYEARIYFLAPTAPAQLLRVGQRFELCVGSVVNARGVVKAGLQQ
jgi:hypothetical protein